MAQPVEITRLRQAIEQFRARAPRDLPDGVMEALGEAEKQLGEVEPSHDSPGANEAQKVGAKNATGVHFSEAAKGTDTPSPGQREALTVSEEMSAAAASLVDKMRESGDGPRPSESS